MANRLSVTVAVDGARNIAPPFPEARLPRKLEPFTLSAVDATVLVGESPSDSEAIAPPLPLSARLFRNVLLRTFVATANAEMPNRFAEAPPLRIAPPSPFLVTL